MLGAKERKKKKGLKRDLNTGCLGKNALSYQLD